jgi:serine/threonine protein kinase/WD40 repeat protein
MVDTVGRFGKPADHSRSPTMNNLSQVEAIFSAVLEKSSSDERAAYLDQACAADPALRRQVEELLRAHQQAGNFLENPPAKTVSANPEPAPQTPGMRIGPYKLLQQIGEGGMGTVWMAEQTEPVKRIVALKVIKPGLDSGQVIARFEAERQALALMDHPNIAKVLDAGTTGFVVPPSGGSSGDEENRLKAALQTGRPYFVMELVKGIPITKYCDERRLSPRQRLELFIPVCQAVQHAHQKGIIHRDLKPSNVLVALYDGKPVPKVIDFGVAKAAGPKLTERTLFTDFGAIVGTLEYMSPEQAELNQLDIDTRSDIYSLGVLLYELLTGSTPLDRKRFKEGAVLELLRLIREEEPPKPSTRLSTSEELPTLSAQRSTEPAKLSKLVRGELDWIVMKALEKERMRRYETANGLAMDIQRYLTDEPVQAGPPSAAYRMRKFIKRNRGAVLAASVVLATLLAGIAGTTWGWFEALHQGAISEKARKDETEARNKLAQSDRSHRQARKRAAEIALGRGLNLCLEGNSHHGLLWLAQSLQLVPDDAPDLERVIRTNLAGWGGQFVPFHPARLSLSPPIFRPDGKAYLAQIGLAKFDPKGLLGQTDPGKFQLHDSATGKPIGPVIPTTGYFSPGGKRLVSGTKLWDPIKGTSVAFTNEGTFFELKFDSDGRLGIFQTHDFDEKRNELGRKIRLFDTATGKKIAILLSTGPRQYCSADFVGKSKAILVYSPSASPDTSREYRLFDRSGKPNGQAFKLPGNKGAVWHSRDSRYLLVQGEDEKKAQVWDALTGKPQGMPLEVGKIQNAAFSPDDKILVTSSDKVSDEQQPPLTIRLWNPVSGKPLRNDLDSPLVAEGFKDVTFRFLNGGKSLIIDSLEGLGFWWDLSTDFPTEATGGGLGNDRLVWMNASQTRMLSMGKSGILTLSSVVPKEFQVAPICHLRGGPFTYRFEILDLPRGTPPGPIGTPLFFDDQFIRWGMPEQKTWKILDTETGQLVAAHLYPELLNAEQLHRTYPLANKSLGPSSDPYPLFSPDSQQVFIAGQLLDLASGKAIAHLELEKDAYFTGAAFEADGKHLVTVSGNVIIRWDSATGKMIGTPFVLEKDLEETLISPNGKTAVTGKLQPVRDLRFTLTLTVRLWDLTNRKLLAEVLQTPFAGPKSLADFVLFSPDGRTLLTYHVDRPKFSFVIGCWDAVTGRFLHSQKKSTGWLGLREHGFAFLPSGDYAMHNLDVGHGLPRGMTIFARSTRKTLDTLPFSGRVSPDGKTLLTHEKSPDPLTGSELTGKFEFFNIATRKKVSPVLRKVESADPLWSPDGKTLAFRQPLPINQGWAPPEGPNAMNPTKTYFLDTVTGELLGPPLENCFAGEFSPDSRFFLTGGTLFTLPTSIKGTPERTALWAEILTGLKLDEHGDAVPLSHEELRSRLGKLEQLGGAPLR